jgi:hypothetical protein
MKRCIFFLILSLGLLLNFSYAADKIKICHFTSSLKNKNYVIIEVDQHALKAHLSHGDLMYDSSPDCSQEAPQPQ